MGLLAVLGLLLHGCAGRSPEEPVLPPPHPGWLCDRPGMAASEECIAAAAVRQGIPEDQADSAMDSAAEIVQPSGKGNVGERLAENATWLLGQPPGNYALQLAALGSLDSLDQFVGRHKLKDPLVIRVVNAEKTWLVVLRGVYADYSTAVREMNALPEELRGPNPWIRRVETLQKLIHPRP